MNRRIHTGRRIGRRISPILLSLSIALPYAASAQSAPSEPAVPTESTSIATTDTTPAHTARAKQGKSGSAKRTASSADTAVAQPGSAPSEPAVPTESTSIATTDTTTAHTARAKQGKTGSAKRTASGTDTAVAQPGSAPVSTDFRGWVPRIDKEHCPNGTTTFVAEDGGVKCWAGPVN